MTKLPTTVKVKGKTWKIMRRWGLTFEGQKVDGLACPVSRTIVLEQGLTREEILPAFLHELGHAILHELHVVSVESGVEEIIVEGFAQTFVDLFKLRLK